MKKSIFITSVSGSGKTTVCKSLKKLGYEAYDIESIPNMFTLVNADTDEILKDKQLGDLKDGLNADWVCNIPKLKELIAAQKDNIAFYCGGTSRTEELMQVFDSTVILQVSDETTVKRLSSRAEGEFGNEQKVRDWVLSWKHRVEANWLAAGGISVSAEPKPDEVARAVASKYSQLV